MTGLLIPGGALVSAIFFALGVREFAGAAHERRSAVGRAERLDRGAGDSIIALWDARFSKTRLGRWLVEELELAGLDRRPIVVFCSAVAAGLAAAYLIWKLFAPALAIIGLLVGYAAMRIYLNRQQDRRREAFVAQLPELARVVANASYAGLSLSTAVSIAGDEMAEPARTELSRVATRLKFGASMQVALDELRERVGSRETNVLISTLLVAARSGGSLVTALRNIAVTLDQRKETRREIQTTLTQVVATSYMVIVIGGLMLLALNVIEEGTVQQMTTHPVGQVVLVISTSLFAAGFFAIRRMTRIEL
ncbi:MAG: type II secretion protein F [Micrococcales bacterium]|nr:MAG: type II secretion protein F [Micrococcales bacterium]